MVKHVDELCILKYAFCVSKVDTVCFLEPLWKIRLGVGQSWSQCTLALVVCTEETGL